MNFSFLVSNLSYYSYPINSYMRTCVFVIGRVLCAPIWIFKVLSRLNIRKTLTGLESCDNWPKRNSAYFTIVGHSQSLLIFSQYYSYLVKVYYDFENKSIDGCDLCGFLEEIAHKRLWEIDSLTKMETRI